MSKFKPLDFSQVRTHSIKERDNKVTLKEFGHPLSDAPLFSQFLDSLPILELNFCTWNICCISLPYLKRFYYHFETTGLDKKPSLYHNIHVSFDRQNLKRSPTLRKGDSRCQVKGGFVSFIPGKTFVKKGGRK